MISNYLVIIEHFSAFIEQVTRNPECTCESMKIMDDMYCKHSIHNCNMEQKAEAIHRTHHRDVRLCLHNDVVNPSAEV